MWLDARVELEPGDDRNLYLFGPSGTGKTGAAFACALADLEANGSPEFLHVGDWLAARKRGFEAARLAEYGGVGEETHVAPDPYPRLAETGLLVLDDLDALRLTAWELGEIASLVQSRYNQSGPTDTIVTTNYSPALLAERLSTRRDPHAGERIVSRLVEGATLVEFAGQNLRLPHTAAADVRRIVEGPGGDELRET